MHITGGNITFTNRSDTIKALIFDFDGLILDTEEPEFNTWQAIYQSYGANLELGEWLACVGASHKAFDPIENLKARVNVPIDVQLVQSEKTKRFTQLMKGMSPLPGVTDYLQMAKTLGLKLAVASSSPSHWVNGFLEQLHLRSLFDTVCVREDVHSVKPDPALYLTAVERLGVKPHEAIAFEDSYNGLLSAKRAGLFCVAVPNHITQSLDFSLADKVLGSLAEISLPDLLTRFNGYSRH